MDRRTFITAAAGMGVIGCAPTWLAQLDGDGLLATRQASQAMRAQSLLLIDTALPESLAFAGGLARELARESAHWIDLEVDAVADVGMLWHAKLRRWTGAINGMLRPSDCFVLRTFSMAQGRVFRTVSLAVRPGRCNCGAQAVAVAFSIDAV